MPRRFSAAAVLLCLGTSAVTATAPGKGSTVLLIGQNWEQEFQDYAQAVQPPAGGSFYTSQLTSSPLAWQGDGLPFLKWANQTYAAAGGFHVIADWR